MVHSTFRYIGELDFAQKIENLYLAYKEKEYQSILFHIYSGVLDEKLVKHISQKIRDKFDTDMIVGTISAGEIKDGRLMDRGVLVSAMMFEQTDVRVYRFSNAENNEISIGEKICKLADSTLDCKALELMLPGTNLHTRVLFEQISRCRRDIQVFGGYAGGHSMEASEHFVFDMNGLYGDMIFLIVYAGKDFHITVDKSVGWQTLGVPFKVTKADENRLITVENRPAVELYEKYMQIEADEHFAEETFEFPLMAELDGEELLRHTITVEPDGTLVLAGYVTEGMNIYLCYGAPADIVKMVDIRLTEIYDFHPQAILLYSCSVRKSFWEDFVNIEMTPFQQIAPTAGFHTWGEVNRDKHNGNVLEYNITLLSIAMREGPAEKDEYPVYVHVDDSVLKGQASLIKRLTKLVSATTNELYMAYNDLSALNDKLQEMADHDGLTGLLNRRKTESVIIECYNSLKQNGGTAGLIMLDIDYFKKVNDTFGHDIGDKTLISAAKIMKQAIADIDNAYAGRWGGEEFMILLPGMNRQQTYVLAERIRTGIEGHAFEGGGSITASLGTILIGGDSNIKEVYIHLDDALYRAKESGRNRTVCAEQTIEH